MRLRYLLNKSQISLEFSFMPFFLTTLHTIYYYSSTVILNFSFFLSDKYSENYNLLSANQFFIILNRLIILMYKPYIFTFLCY